MHFPEARGKCYMPFAQNIVKLKTQYSCYPFREIFSSKIGYWESYQGAMGVFLKKVNECNFPF